METGSGKWQWPLQCLEHIKQLQMYSEIKIRWKYFSIFIKTWKTGLDSETNSCLQEGGLKHIFLCIIIVVVVS